MTDQLQIFARPHPIKSDIVHMEMPAGGTLQEILEHVQPDAFARQYMIVFLSGNRIYPEFYRLIRPKINARIEIKAHPGKDFIAPLLSIVISLIAPWVAGTLLGLTVGTTAYAVVVAGVTMLGGLIVNALVKPPSPEDQNPKSRPGIAGAKNNARLYGSIPLVLGKCLVVPDTAAEPYTELVGENVFLRQVFVVGYGPLEISDIRIGNTPIENYEGVTVEIREGYSTDQDMRLFPDTPYTIGVSAKLRKEVGFITRRTTVDIDEIFIDVEWPQGVGNWNQDGSVDEATVTVEVEYRKVGDVSWTSANNFEQTAASAKQIRRSKRIEVSRGQYDVRLRRTTIHQEDEGFRDEVYWTTLRCLRNEDPIQFPKKLAKIAIRIKATNQLNGPIDELNCIAHSVAKHFNGVSWVEKTTRNPAAMLRLVAQGPAVKRRRNDNRMDFDNLEYWSEKCTENGWNCDSVITNPMSLNELYSNIAATGRAAYISKDSKLGVVIDEEQTISRQMFTPRNIISMSIQKIYNDLPDALRVKFISREAGYREDEVMVYNEGKNKANAQTFETMDMWGKTEPKEAAEFGRYYFWTAKLRPEILQLTTDVEGLVCEPGHMVRVSNDVLLTGLSWGRVTELLVDGGNNILGITIDEFCTIEADTEYGVVIRTEEEPFQLSRRLSNSAETTKTLMFDTPLDPFSIEIGYLVSFGEYGREVSDWTVKEITREEQFYANLTLVPHAPEIHEAARGEIPDYDPIISYPREQRTPNPPTILSILADENAVELIGSSYQPRVVVDFVIEEGDSLPTVTSVFAQVKLGNATDWSIENVEIEDMERVIVRNVPLGVNAKVRIQAISDLGKKSFWSTSDTVIVTGNTNPPPDVTNFALNPLNMIARLSWDLINVPDLAGFKIRHSTLQVGASWADGVDISQVVSGPSIDVPLQIGTYMIRAIDNGGRLSLGTTSVSSSLNFIEGLNFIETLQEDPTFIGSKDRVIYSVSAGGLILAPGHDLIEDEDLLDVDWLSVDMYSTEGVYEFFNKIDLGSVVTSRITAELRVSSVDLTTDLFNWEDILVRDWLDSDVIISPEVQIEISMTQEDPTEGGWSAWQNFIIGDFTARAFKFRLRMFSDIQGVTPVVEELRVSVDMPDRIISFEATIPVGGSRVEFNPAFYVSPQLGIAVTNGLSGDRSIMTIDSSGVNIEFLNSVGASVERHLTGIAKAYGAQQ